MGHHFIPKQYLDEHSNICLWDTSFSRIKFLIILTYDGPSFDILMLWIREEEDSHSVVSNSLRPHVLWPARLLCPWNSPGKNPVVGCHFLLQGTFSTQVSNLGLLCLLHCRRILYHLSQQGSGILNKMTSKLGNFGVTLLLVSFVPWISYVLAYS